MEPAAGANPDRMLDLAGLQALIDLLRQSGYDVVGPRVVQGAVVYAPAHRVDDLPRGWGDEQDAGLYRLRRRDDDALFGFATAVQAAKPVFFPTEQVLWRTQGNGEPRLQPEEDDRSVGGAEGVGPYAVLGLRACDLHAVAIHDAVLASRGLADVHYVARRSDAFVVAVSCTDPGGTCFCVSMGTGPKPDRDAGASYDLCLTELLGADGHRFLVEVGSPRGAEVLGQVPTTAARPEDRKSADDVVQASVARMGRSLDTDGIRELLYDSAESRRWDDVAARCLACTNCTAVCPTCFCTTNGPVTDLTGDSVQSRRLWDSCFNADFSYIHGGVVRESVRARYRQWMTHKLASWIDQFGMSGCVGCGRCITWCPAAIDITAEAAALRALATSGHHDGRVD